MVLEVLTAVQSLLTNGTIELFVVLCSVKKLKKNGFNKNYYLNYLLILLFKGEKQHYTGFKLVRGEGPFKYVTLKRGPDSVTKSHMGEGRAEF